MSKSLTKKINVFLTVDLQTLDSYFNNHDPAPLYKRQLNHKLEEYIMKAVAANKRYSVIFYKLKCTSDIDRQYAEPLMYAIRRHFAEKKNILEHEFNKFKRRSWILLLVSVAVVILLRGFVPLILNEGSRIHHGLENCLDVFSWVILWRPINVLIFEWNPHLKDISLLNKLGTAEVIIIENEKLTEQKQNKPAAKEITETKLAHNIKSAISI